MLDIIIVNWNSGGSLSECIESIGAARKDGFELSRVVVVDNASQDGLPDDLEDLRLPLVLLRNKENRGFAVACNQGAQGSKADFLLFLNPDTRLFKNSLTEPLSFMGRAENRDIAILGIQLVDEKGRASRTCARFPAPHHFLAHMLGLYRLYPRLFQDHFMREWDHGESRDVDHVMGAFFLIRRQLFEDLGGFDEQFFVYLEDLDLSFRARKAGWRTYYLITAQVYHKGGGASEQAKAMRLFYSLRSRIFYGYKHFTLGTATALMLATLLLEPWARIGLALSMRSHSRIKETLKAYVYLWESLLKWVFHR